MCILLGHLRYLGVMEQVFEMHEEGAIYPAPIESEIDTRDIRTTACATTTTARGCGARAKKKLQ